MLRLDRIVLSRFLFNGEPIYSYDPKEILETILISSPNIHFWSYEALKDYIIGTFQMIHEFGKQVKEEIKLSGSSSFGEVSRKFTTFSSWSSKAIRFLPKSRERLIYFVYDIIMSCEGNGLLPGFGMSNKHKDTIPGNPEKVSIYDLPHEIPVKGGGDVDSLG